MEQLNCPTCRLARSNWSDDLMHAHRPEAALEAGSVQTDNASPHGRGVPFGGYKLSGSVRKQLLASARARRVHANLKGSR